MCNLYGSTDARTLRTLLFQGVDDGLSWDATVAPLGRGVFVRQDHLAQVGQWGMIPPGAKERIPKTREGRRLSTNNARRETVSSAWTFRQPWARGQRCLIPATWFQEPYWGITHADPMGMTRNTWWRFWRADGQPWMLAGLWSEWTDPATGEVVPNYTMLTQNCDGHAVLALMHKPDPKLPPDRQDKRTVVPIERDDWDLWLHGPQEAAEGLIRVPAEDMLRHGPAEPDSAPVSQLPLL
ncbi:MAG: SOS response-associated peptidase family protein [Hydrogenophaga sp.]|nr:SOS response-associated peptidase family protein [Hydrogenophaga sp.]